MGYDDTVRYLLLGKSSAGAHPSIMMHSSTVFENGSLLALIPVLLAMKKATSLLLGQIHMHVVM